MRLISSLSTLLHELSAATNQGIQSYEVVAIPIKDGVLPRSAIVDIKLYDANQLTSPAKIRIRSVNPAQPEFVVPVVLDLQNLRNCGAKIRTFGRVQLPQDRAFCIPSLWRDLDFGEIRYTKTINSIHTTTIDASPQKTFARAIDLEGTRYKLLVYQEGEDLEIDLSETVLWGSIDMIRPIVFKGKPKYVVRFCYLEPDRDPSEKSVGLILSGDEFSKLGFPVEESQLQEFDFSRFFIKAVPYLLEE